MKKLICFILLFLLLFSLTACFETTHPDTGKTDEPTGTTPPNDPDTGKTDEPTATNVFDTIHAALAAPGTHFTLSVLTKSGDITLNASCDIHQEETYAGTMIEVSYEFEHLNTIQVDANGNITFPKSMKTTYQGSAKIRNGALTEMDGKAANFPLLVVNVAGIRFTAENLSEYHFEEGTLTAKVNSPSALFGKEIDAKDMNVTVTLFGTSIGSMEITYHTADNAEVTLQYRTVQ